MSFIPIADRKTKKLVLKLTLLTLNPVFAIDYLPYNFNSFEKIAARAVSTFKQGCNFKKCCSKCKK